MSDDGEQPEEHIIVDYEVMDEVTGFKKVELQIWRAFEEAMAKPEDERPDPDAFVDDYSEEKKLDKRRVKYVVSMGIYAGPRDEFNQRSGSGKAIYANGDVYEGDFFEGVKHGQGHYIFKKLGKSEIDGLVEKQLKDKPAGESSEAFAKRCAEALRVGVSIVETALEYGFFPCYHGDYQRGLRVGQGLMKNKDCSVYKGEWKDNRRHGQGIFYYVNGDVYSGQWDTGLKHGYGTYRFAKGGEYRGEWTKGVFTEGQWIHLDGTYYEGLFDKKNRPCDTDASVHFPQRQISMQGVFRKGKWAPQNEFHVNAEVPSNEPWDA